ncbi:MAG: methionyl-tRNA formyltransferase [Bacillota bacterium]|nr:methionyl-tRNA formyltransferase [Bacillota bacterium]
MMQPARVVYMGTPDYAATILRSLARDPRFDIVLVVSQPDRPQGRRRELLPTPVRRVAEECGLPLIQPERVRDEAFATAIREVRPELILTAAYGRILVPWVLDIPPRGAVNVHASLLPLYRGAAPVQAALLAGDRETGISWLLMDEEVDHGPVLYRKPLEILDTDDSASLMERLAQLAAAQTGDVLAAWLAGEIEPEEQDHGAATFTRLLRREDGEIDWARPASELALQVRGLRPWPGAWTMLDGERVKIHAASARAGEGGCELPPGSLIGIERGGIRVATGSGELVIGELQLAGRGRQPADAVGHNLAPDTRFGRSSET